VNGNLSATGVVTGSSYQIGSNLFAFGSYANLNAFLGFAGNTTMTGTDNTASGVGALFSNTTGNDNSASGLDALYSNTTGNYNTASGSWALYSNTTGSGNNATGLEALYSNTGSYNTASGEQALYSNTTGSGNTSTGDWALQYNTTGGANTAIGAFSGLTTDRSSITGSSNTFLGYNTSPSTGTLNNATAIGAYAEVDESNAMVLGSINGVNGAAANTLVGIGTTAPSYLLHIGNQGGISYNNFLRVEGPASGSGNAISVGGHGDVGIDAPGVSNGRFVVKDNGIVAIGIPNPLINPFQIKQGLGHALADGWDTYSSRRWKTNIHTLHGALATVEHLRGVSYNLKNSGKHEIGVIAEEVGVVVPEVVSWEENGTDARSVDYGRLTALLIEATKEQQKLIHQQQEQIRAQQAQSKLQQAEIARLSSQIKVIQTSLSGNRRTSSVIRPVRVTMSVAKQ